jgi:hypothetical protein
MNARGSVAQFPRSREEIVDAGQKQQAPREQLFPERSNGCCDDHLAAQGAGAIKL